MTNIKRTTFLVYDGIRNSVFTSQVLHPLLKQLEQDNNLEIFLVSFEKEKPSNKMLCNLIPAHDRLHLIIARKFPFFGKLSLKIAQYQLKKILETYSTNQITARGPLAGWLAIEVLKKFKNLNKTLPTLKIQARGLCAQEYRFTNQNLHKYLLGKKIREFVYKKLNQIESETYKEKNIPIEIEAVSPALKDYLVTNFEVFAERIIIANKDIPPKLDQDIIKKCRKKIRTNLGLKNDYYVYCYSGSYKSWQGIMPSIDFFLTQYKKNSNSFLLILSQDKDKIEQLLLEKNMPSTNYLLLSVKPEELPFYLAACDAGLLFRDKDIINWVSRPTKMLEYQAAGLKIIHNNTIAWLANQI